MKPYNKTNIPLAKQLRKNMTPWERKLWYEYLRYSPLRFQRQKAIGNYIADFYCAKAQLVIELDGSGHYEPAQVCADAVRTQELENRGLRVLRICNLDVDRNFSGVCEYIDGFVRESLPQSASLTAPSSDGALESARPGTIYALGFFDGVHLGHQALLAACRTLADNCGAKAGVVTFTAHPDTLVLGKAPALINTPADRKMLLKQYHMDTVQELPFDRAMMQMPWQEFFRLLREEYGAAGLVCGADFRFGYKGEGDSEKLSAACAEADMPCTVVPQQRLSGTVVSSTHIRKLLEAGKMAEAVHFLGHGHVLTGTVLPGRQLGRTIGIPTANLALSEGVVCPRYGVYACKATVDGAEFLAVTNIGTRPTVAGSHVTVEAHLLDFDGDLYGKALTLQFYEFLRPEEKFDSLETLQAEIQKNAAQTRKIFEKS